MTESFEEDFHEIKGKKLGDLSISEILIEMVTHGADESELRMMLPNGIGLLLGIRIKDIIGGDEL